MQISSHTRYSSSYYLHIPSKSVTTQKLSFKQLVCRIGKGNEELQEHILKGRRCWKTSPSVNWLVNGLTCPDSPRGRTVRCDLVGGWTNPSEKICSSKWECLKPPASDLSAINVFPLFTATGSSCQSHNQLYGRSSEVKGWYSTFHL